MHPALPTALIGLALAPASARVHADSPRLRALPEADAAAPAASSRALAGTWAGGTNATGPWRFVEATIAARDGGFTGSLAVPGENAAGLPLRDIRVEGDSVRFGVWTPLGTLRFRGALHGDALEGSLEGGAPGAALHLVRLAEPPAAQADAAVGRYDAGGGRTLLLTYRAHAELTAVLIARTENGGEAGEGGGEAIERAFYALPIGPDRYLTSGSVVRALTRDETLSLERDADGRVTGVRIESPGAPPRTARRIPGADQRTAHIRGEAGRITGTLFLPPGPGPHPAVALVSGSGPAGRDEIVLRARAFVRLGVAALTWDKRGVGDTDGDYFAMTFDDQAADADSALAWLRAQREVDPARTGMSGHSQGGWIVPLATVRAAVPPAWIVITSAGPETPREQEIWRARSQALAAGLDSVRADSAAAFMRRKWDFAYTGRDWDGYLAAALRARKAPWGGLVAPLFVPDSLAWTFMRSLRDFDPMAAPSRLRLPTLVLFGDRDDEEPWHRSRALWEEAFRAAGNERGRIVVLPGAAHSLWFGRGSPRPLEAAPTRAIGRWLAGLGVIRAPARSG